MDAKIQVITRISPEDINLGNSYIELAPIKWTEGSGITQFMRAEISLLDCELEHEKKTLTIKINFGADFSLKEGIVTGKQIGRAHV